MSLSCGDLPVIRMRVEVPSVLHYQFPLAADALVHVKIYFRWRDNSDPKGIANVFGFDELYLTYKDGRWQIKSDYGEFNNAVRPQ